ncbi:MAG TPA: ribosome biogenesis GTPase YlqF [Bacillota bacterium]|nr:ribosome biogenesis GTPase YlqF [Bacillota bacterium]
MSIQWYPGHMAKAKREVEENLKLVDIVIELRDARAPYSSENPMMQEIIHHKQKIIVCMKKDLADHKETEKWIQHFEQEGNPSLAIDANHPNDIDKLIKKVNDLGEELRDKKIKKGVSPRPIRALILGIPNVGKSTLINRLANKRIAKVGDRPGVTRHQSWIKVQNSFELLDTPGILWPKFEDEDVGVKLAAIGTIKDHLVPLQDVAAKMIMYLQESYPEGIKKRYHITEHDYDMWEVFEKIGRKYGALESGGKVNFDRVANIILYDLRAGKLGEITLETVKEIFE